jgi:hypothetical protein
MKYRCNKCLEDKIQDCFFKDKTQSRGFDYRCKECKKPILKIISKRYREENREHLNLKQREYAKKNPNVFINNSLKFHYGITLDDYNLMLEKQGGVCAICGGVEINKRQKRLFVDHNHITGKVRGLLCLNCNTVVGHCKEDVSYLAKAIEYIEIHK